MELKSYLDRLKINKVSKMALGVMTFGLIFSSLIHLGVVSSRENQDYKNTLTPAVATILQAQTQIENANLTSTSVIGTLDSVNTEMARIGNYSNSLVTPSPAATPNLH